MLTGDEKAIRGAVLDVAGLHAENERLRTALEKICEGYPPGEVCRKIAREALEK